MTRKFKLLIRPFRVGSGWREYPEIVWAEDGWGAAEHIYPEGTIEHGDHLHTYVLEGQVEIMALELEPSKTEQHDIEEAEGKKDRRKFCEAQCGNELSEAEYALDHFCMQCRYRVTPMDAWTVLDVSTCHITKKDDELLENELKHNNTDVLCGYYTGYGYMVFVGADINRPAVDEQLEKAGYSESFREILYRGVAYNCRYVNFDCDANVYAGIPKYKW